MTEILSHAEQRSEEANRLPDFAGFALRGAKRQVAELLDTLGRVSGIFATYTDHSIRHIDHMLGMLDWVIPTGTKEKMTPVDWLMITLGIYYHDLGMVISKKEFEKRGNNGAFQGFRNEVLAEAKYSDFRSRAGIADSSVSEEQDAFLYQEYVRTHHAQRIKQWITGRVYPGWADGVDHIVSAVDESLRALPSRFREHLAIVCESHHLNDLNDTERYPLYQLYGLGGQACSANVQYAAVLLRTVDLLHVTKDRTPSVAYNIIGITDPIGIREWQRQQGTFAVHPRHREIDPEDPESQVIVVEADFDTERGFFPLSEYIAWANTEFQESRRWVDKSQTTADGKDYAFPWRHIEARILVDGKRPQPLKFVLDRDRLLNLLVGHTLYNDPTVVIRELVQNAIDAVRFQRHLDRRQSGSPSDGRVLVHWNDEARELIVEDNGTGMDQDVIENHLMRVGASFYESENFKASQPDFTPISRFGIGVLTCFMVSDDIEIVTVTDSGAFRLRMTSAHADYLLNPLDKGHAIVHQLAPHGTVVKLRLRRLVDLEGRSVLDIVRHWIILPDCPIFYCEADRRQQVGFVSIEDALQAAFPQKTKSRQHGSVVFTEGDNQGVSYQLAIVVNEADFATDRSFVTTDVLEALDRHSDKQRRLTLPLVCVEGVRVDNRIPGVGRRIAGILSVRGNRSFRTTVARDGLEEDDEYQSVATKSIDLAFRHVNSEIDRISSLSGPPLSQASSAAGWLVKDLRNSVGTDFRGRRPDSVAHHLEKLISTVPSIVVEDTSEAGDGEEITRRLCSRKTLTEKKEFWTLESRAFNYLGIVSRDLGREVAIHKFIESIGIELEDMPLVPLVVDAAMHASWILENFKPKRVSMKHDRQYAKILWEVMEQDKSTLRIDASTPAVREFLECVQSEGSRDAELIMDGARRVRVTRAGKFEDELERVAVLYTSMAVFLSESTSLGNTWELLSDNFRRAKEGQQEEALLLHLGLLAIEGFCLRIHPNALNYGELLMNPARFGFATWWGRMHKRIDDALGAFGQERKVPERLEELQLRDEDVIDIRSFWRDWGTGGEDQGPRAVRR